MLMILLLELMEESLMVNGLIIVSPNPNEEIFRVDNLSPGEHGSKILEYLYSHNLNFDGCEQEMRYTLACYLAKLNYLVDTIENKKHYVYLGEKIYETQYQWFRSNKKELRNTNGVIDVLDNGINHYDFYTLDEGIKPFSVLKDLIEERRVSDNYVSRFTN